MKTTVPKTIMTGDPVTALSPAPPVPTPLNRLMLAIFRRRLGKPAQAQKKVEIYQVGEPLPSPIKVGRKELPLEVKRQLLPLMKPDAEQFLLHLAVTWVTMIGVIYLAARVHSIWLSALAVCFVATRQNVLGLLMHEQTHWLGAPARWLDYVCELAVAYPLMVTLEGYRLVHLTHHIDYFTDKDPDYRRKQGEEWTFPQHMRFFLTTLLKDLTGMNVVKGFKAKGTQEGSIPANFYPPRWLKPLFLASLAVGLSLTHTWTVYLVYWLLPLLTLMQVIIRWGAIAEHKYNLISPAVEESTPLIELAWWEKLLLPNLNFTLHIYHHWFPNIPAYALPKVHQIFRQAGLIDDRYVFHGNVDYIRFLVGKHKYFQPSTDVKTPTQAVQDVLQKLPGVDRVVTLGDYRKFPVALVSLNLFTDTALSSSALDKIESDLRKSLLTIEEKFRPAGVLVLPRQLTVQDQEITPTLKVRHQIVEEKYSRVLDRFYQMLEFHSSGDAPIWVLDPTNIHTNIRATRVRERNPHES